ADQGPLSVFDKRLNLRQCLPRGAPPVEGRYLFALNRGLEITFARRTSKPIDEKAEKEKSRHTPEDASADQAGRNTSQSKSEGQEAQSDIPLSAAVRRPNRNRLNIIEIKPTVIFRVTGRIHAEQMI